jgi:hypothetical protein
MPQIHGSKREAARQRRVPAMLRVIASRRWSRNARSLHSSASALHLPGEAMVAGWQIAPPADFRRRRRRLLKNAIIQRATYVAGAPSVADNLSYHDQIPKTHPAQNSTSVSTSSATRFIPHVIEPPGPDKKVATPLFVR